MTPPPRNHLEGALLGCALGDALGLAWEGMSARAIARRTGGDIKNLQRYGLLGNLGFVSDDTEQSALVAQALAHGRGDVQRAVRSLRGGLRWWFLRLPWGIGFATLRAGLKLCLGLRRTGVASAGNGAAMRMAIVGAYFAEDSSQRQAHAKALAEVTHLDPRGVEGAAFVAEVAAAAARSEDLDSATIRDALCVVEHPQLRDRIERGLELAQREDIDHPRAAEELGASGFVVDTLGYATFCLLRATEDFTESIAHCVSGGGDTDTIAAILGAWLGARDGADRLPSELLEGIVGGPFGVKHLRRLSDALANGDPPPHYWPLLALFRNLAMYPLILFHGFRRLVGF